jgi:hypothetical protein
MLAEVWREAAALDRIDINIPLLELAKGPLLKNLLDFDWSVGGGGLLKSELRRRPLWNSALPACVVRCRADRASVGASHAPFACGVS